MVKRGGPMFGEGPKAKQKPAPTDDKPKKSVDVVLAAAKKLEGEAAAKKLIDAIRRVDKPQKLVEPIFDALLDAKVPIGTIAERFVELCKGLRDEPAFLDEVAYELDNRYHEDHALEVLRMAVAAGSKSKRTLEHLGRQLCIRGDAAGVPLLERAMARDAQWSPPRITLAMFLADKEPDRALQLVDGCDDSKAHEVRAIIHEAAGRSREANLALREALEEYDDDIAGRSALADWHYNENRYPRAHVHTKVLFELRRKASGHRLEYLDLDDIDETIVRGFRLGGGFEEIVPWLVERCDQLEVKADLAWHVFYGLTAFHPTREPQLAIRCAQIVQKRDRKVGDLAEARAWTVRIALERTHLGETNALSELAKTGLDDDPAAWVELADAYYALDQFDAAHAALDRALQLDADSANAMATLFNLALAAGDEAGLHKAAEAIAAAQPLWHQGPEHLARSHARRGEADAAVAHAKRAAQLGPYCQNAWAALCEASIVAGDFERANEALARSIAIDAATPGDDISILVAVLAKEPAALERALAERFKHLPAPPFPIFLARLRAAATRA
jgi:tetratricopeptide (TPR) repeat protein